MVGFFRAKALGKREVGGGPSFWIIPDTKQPPPLRDNSTPCQKTPPRYLLSRIGEGPPSSTVHDQQVVLLLLTYKNSKTHTFPCERTTFRGSERTNRFYSAHASRGIPVIYPYCLANPNNVTRFSLIPPLIGILDVISDR